MALRDMQVEAGFRFFEETPEVHSSDVVQAFIEQEIVKPNKVWVHDVLGCRRESECVKLRTPEFVLLPDLVASRRHYRPVQRQPWDPPCKLAPRLHKQRGALECGEGKVRACCPAHCPVSVQTRALNWLAIATDPGIKSIRDLRGEHVEMLERLYDQCVRAIQKEYKLERHDIMVFANYPPSVYKLHFHFCAPFFTSTAYDAFRMHPLSNIINNLRLCPEYYKLSSFHVPLHVGSEFFRITCAQDDARGEEANTE